MKATAPSTKLNPYLHFLNGRDPVAVMTRTPAVLDEIVAALGAERIESRARPGGWTAREIVCHLADTEIAFAFRLRQIMSEEHHVIQPFDQDRWNGLLPQRSVEDALEAFKALRHGTVALALSLSGAQRARPTTHPERGEMTMNDVLATIAGHDLNHLQQLVSIRDAGGAPRRPEAGSAATGEEQ
jgi:hypothetical protein